MEIKNGLYKYPGKSKMYVKKYLMESVPAEELKKQMIDDIFVATDGQTVIRVGNFFAIMN